MRSNGLNVSVTSVNSEDGLLRGISHGSSRSRSFSSDRDSMSDVSPRASDGRSPRSLCRRTWCWTCVAVVTLLSVVAVVCSRAGALGLTTLPQFGLGPVDTTDAPSFTYYMYRSQSDEAYPPLNTNLASLGGVLWYLHNEVVDRCDSGRGGGERGFRRFKITRVLRYKVTTRATNELYARGMNFGVRVAFDAGACTGGFQGANQGLVGAADCARMWDTYGYVVGCNLLGHGPYPACPPYGADGHGEGFCPINYPGATWYSVAGPCPNNRWDQCTPELKEQMPGGYVEGVPEGTRNSTWTYEDAGEINLDELVGIKEKYGTHANFCASHCIEYIKYGPYRDQGSCTSWWDQRHNRTKNVERMQRLDDFFKLKYPSLPSDAELKAPRCDFNKSAFYEGMLQPVTV